MIVYLNGAFLPAAEARISVFDGGYLYGDGIYTTLRLYKGLPLDLVAHHRRLQEHTAQLQISFSMSLDELRGIIAELVQRNNLQHADGRLRITLSRQGTPEEPLPLTDPARLPTTVVMLLSPVAQAIAQWQAEGIPVISLPAGHARGNFPALKTLNALPAVSALRTAAAAGCPEAFLTSPAGHLLEGAVSNIFLVRSGTLVTPRSEGGFLAGRTRERIFGLAAGDDIPAREKTVTRQDLPLASEIFVVSSVREILPVIAVDGQTVGNGAPGPLTRKLQVEYRALINRELAAQSGQ